MNNQKSNIAVLIGRWQIPQIGHGTLFKAALAQAPKVLVVIGSAFHARDPRNPFTWGERQEMLESFLTPQERERVSFLPIRDYYDNARWCDAVKRAVAAHTSLSDRITLVGFKKDHTSGYLDDFPGWGLIEVAPKWEISSTDLRNIYFDTSSLPDALKVIGSYVEPGVRAYLEAWAHLPAYRKVTAEHKQILRYRQEYSAPFYFTADALVTTNNHLLMVRRGGAIGQGLWALPGGFVEPNELTYDAAIRELEEETSFKSMPDRMRRALLSQTLFEHPLRSLRGRIVTNVFHFELDDPHCPHVQARDDAKLAQWIPIGELAALESEIFEDHAMIIDHHLHIFADA